jgi:uncharacterized protein YrrD
MLISFGDLIRYSAQVEDSLFSIKDVFFSFPARRPIYLLLDTGSWFDTHLVLVRAATVIEISAQNRALRLDTTTQQIEAAPVLQEETSHSMEAMPPIVIGPFGNAVSPLMMAALARREMQDAPDEDPAQDHHVTDTLTRFSEILKMEVFGRDGELGRLDDILIDADSLAITHLVIDDGGILPGQLHVVPIDRFRHVAEGDTHIVLDLDIAARDAAPKLEEVDLLDRRRFEAMHGYTHLPI